MFFSKSNNEKQEHTTNSTSSNTDTTSTKNSFNKLPTSPISEAVGISYTDGQDKTPVISSKGAGAMADAIVEMANELGIYIHRDKQLLNQLKTLKEGEEIPRELFEVIAQILTFSYILQGKTPEAWTRPDGSRAININA